MSDNNAEASYRAQDLNYGPNTVYNIVKGRLGTMVDQAILQSHLQVSDSSTVMGRFKNRLENFLSAPLSHVMTGPDMDQRLHTVHQEIKGAVEGAVDSTIQELNITVINSTVKESLVTTLDSEIEMSMLSEVFSNVTRSPDDDSDFFHSLPIKDEAMFVALVSMAVVIPIIFITLLVMFLYRRHKEVENRRQEMLLRDQPEFSMEDCNIEDRYPLDKGVPDLDLKRLRI